MIIIPERSPLPGHRHTKNTNHLDEVIVIITADGAGRRAELQIRWRGGAISELTVPLKRAQPKIRTDDNTIELIRRLAVHHADAVVAGILNRQGRRTARDLSYTANRVQSLRHHWGITCHQQGTEPNEGELLRGRSRRHAGTRILHPAPLARRRVHRRRTDHPWCPVADSHERSTTRSVRR
jgi:hypothetical protein